MVCCQVATNCTDIDPIKSNTLLNKFDLSRIVAVQLSIHKNIVLCNRTNALNCMYNTAHFRRSNQTNKTIFSNDSIIHRRGGLLRRVLFLNDLDICFKTIGTFHILNKFAYIIYDRFVSAKLGHQSRNSTKIIEHHIFPWKLSTTMRPVIAHSHHLSYNFSL